MCTSFAQPSDTLFKNFLLQFCQRNLRPVNCKSLYHSATRKGKIGCFLLLKSVSEAIIWLAYGFFYFSLWQENSETVFWYSAQKLLLFSSSHFIIKCERRKHLITLKFFWIVCWNYDLWSIKKTIVIVLIYFHRFCCICCFVVYFIFPTMKLLSNYLSNEHFKGFDSYKVN